MAGEDGVGSIKLFDEKEQGHFVGEGERAEADEVGGFFFYGEGMTLRSAD